MKLLHIDSSVLDAKSVSRQLSAEVVLTDPTGSSRPPVRMTKRSDVPDLYEAWVTPDLEGAWTFEIQAWSDPIATWEHDAGLKIPAGVDVELMFTEARLLINRVIASDGLDERERRVLSGAAQAAADDDRPVEARLAVLQSPDLVEVLTAHPLRELVTPGLLAVLAPRHGRRGLARGQARLRRRDGRRPRPCVTCITCPATG